MSKAKKGEKLYEFLNGKNPFESLHPKKEAMQSLVNVIVSKSDREEIERNAANFFREHLCDLLGDLWAEEHGVEGARNLLSL